MSLSLVHRIMILSYSSETYLMVALAKALSCPPELTGADMESSV